MENRSQELDQTQAELARQKGEVIKALQEIQAAHPEICDFTGLTHEVFVFNHTHGYLDHLEDEVVEGPFRGVSFFGVGVKVIEQTLKQNRVIFRHEQKTLTCCPEIYKNRLTVNYYESN